MKKKKVKNITIMIIAFLGLQGTYHLAKKKRKKSKNETLIKKDKKTETLESTNYITIYQTLNKSNNSEGSYNKAVEVEMDKETLESSNNIRKYYLLRPFIKKENKDIKKEI